MSETKYHQIRLFGSTIQLPPNDAVSATHHRSSCSSNGSVSPQTIFYKDSFDLEVEHVSSNSILESINEDQPKSSTEDKESNDESSNSLDKPLKKPTKIIPCPRCQSTDTKFCYFNNYNANQPRHFCKNCQRYWTAGGSMRNMPVGAGRRKNKTTVCSSPLPVAALETSLRQENEPFAPQLHSFSGPLWASPWTAGQPHGFLHSGYPVPIYAGPPYWDCRAMANWNMAWMQQTSDSARPSSPLGKHPRDRNKTKTSNKEHHGEDHRTESTVLFPKTLRIDDPTEAAKSSIWTTLGIKSHKNMSCSDSGAFFERFQSKGEESSAANESSRVLNANPAALSRSLTFHESAE